jgi:hypothetical protein
MIRLQLPPHMAIHSDTFNLMFYFTFELFSEHRSLLALERNKKTEQTKTPPINPKNKPYQHQLLYT